MCSCSLVRPRRQTAFGLSLRPQHVRHERGRCDMLLCAPVLCAPVVDQDVVAAGFATYDLLICGRCKPDVGDERLIQPQSLTSPKTPTAAERALHALTHRPYRDWCPFCVAGNRPNSPHRRVKSHADLPMMGADYAFFGDAGNLITYLVVLIRPFGVFSASVVDSKGATPHAVRVLSDWIKMCGLVQFLYRSDLESSIKHLAETAVRESGRGGQPCDVPVDLDDPGEKLQPMVGKQDVPDSKPTQLAAPEHSHVGASHSNGMTERAVRMVEDQTRTIKAALDDRLQCVVDQAHPIMHWFIRHSATRSNGFTLVLITSPDINDCMAVPRPNGWQNLASSSFTTFPRTKHTKLETKWRHGIFLGRSWNRCSNFIVLAHGQITTARAMTRCVEAHRWQRDRVPRVTGTPLNHTLAFDDSVESTASPHKGPDGHREDGPDVDEKLPRRLAILPRDMINYGLIDGCSNCQLYKDGQTPNARNHEHSEACRAKVYAAMRKDKGPRIAVADARGQHSTQEPPA